MTHTHPLNGPFSGTTQVSQYQKSKNQSGIYWSKRQWVAVASAGPYASLHLARRSRQITTPAPHHSCFLQAGCPSCRPTNSVKALKGSDLQWHVKTNEQRTLTAVHSCPHMHTQAKTSEEWQKNLHAYRSFSNACCELSSIITKHFSVPRWAIARLYVCQGIIVWIKWPLT